MQIYGSCKCKSIVKIGEFMLLSVKQRLYLKGLAHGLNPVVMIGQKGLTPSVIKEIDQNLLAHELIKIRVLSDDREYRESLIEPICENTQAVFIAKLGKLLIFYRPNEESKIKLG